MFREVLSIAMLVVAAGSSPWPMFRRSAIHDAATPHAGPTSNKTAWTFQLSGPVYSSPAIGDNVVYIGTYEEKKGTLFALNLATGASMWQFTAGGPIGATPCIIDSLSLVVFGAADGYVYAVDGSSGAMVWKYRHALFSKFQVASSPVYIEGSGGTGRLFFGTSDSRGDIFALTLQGRNKPSLLWTLTTGSDGVPGACAFDAEELFVGANDGKVYAIGAGDGKVHWTAQTNGIVYSSPVLSPDRKAVYVGSNDGNFYALNRTSGAVLWNLLTPGWVDSSAAVPDDNSVYIATSNGNGLQNYAAMYKLNSQTGEVLWTQVLASEDGVYDPVVAGSTVYAGSVNDATTAPTSGGSVWAWDTKTGHQLWRLDTNGHVGAAPAIGSNGEMVIGDRGGIVYKLNGPADESILV